MSRCSSNDSNSTTNVNESIIHIDLADRHQTVRNFGASDAWACQFIGVWPDEKRNQVADWLFSQEVDDAGKEFKESVHSVINYGVALWLPSYAAWLDKFVPYPPPAEIERRSNNQHAWKEEDK